LEKPEGGDEDGPPSTDEDVEEKEADETDDEMSTTSEERGEAGGASSLPPGSQETPENYAGYFEKQREARCAIHAARSEFARCQLPRLSRSFMFALVLARCVGCGLFA
jgi:hypothetical protein